MNKNGEGEKERRMREEGGRKEKKKKKKRALARVLPQSNSNLFPLLLLSPLSPSFDPEKSYLIPNGLPDERPVVARENWPPWEDNANQAVRIFEFQFLPHGFLGRLMVRVLAAFAPVCYWKNGLLVKGMRNGKDSNAKALIEYNPSMCRGESRREEKGKKRGREREEEGGRRAPHGARAGRVRLHMLLEKRAAREGHAEREGQSENVPGREEEEGQRGRKRRGEEERAARETMRPGRV
jgi:hypothetical protein